MGENTSKINVIAHPTQASVSKRENTASEVAKRGRPPGAKNKETLFKELMTGQFQEIASVNVLKTFEVLFEKAHAGDIKAIKLILDRVVPVTKAVDLADMEKKGLTVNITVGRMEDVQVSGEIIEEAEFSVITEPL